MAAWRARLVDERRAEVTEIGLGTGRCPVPPREITQPRAHFFARLAELVATGYFGEAISRRAMVM
jgi:hypothetical protein